MKEYTLVETIGIPAMLEQTAEEANELAFACLKLARSLRGENKVHGRSLEEMYDNLAEEMADVMLCFDEMYRVIGEGNNKYSVIDRGVVIDYQAKKMKRMKERLEEYHERDGSSGEDN